MADDQDVGNTSGISDDVEIGVEAVKEDAETTKARRELKQTSITEKGGSPREHSAAPSEDADAAAATTSTTVATSKTPSLTTDDDTRLAPTSNSTALKDAVSSPKKKRAHDELDKHNDDVDVVTLESAEETTVSRTDRSEPEKKRPRDKQEGNGAESPKGSSEPTTVNDNQKTSHAVAAETALKPSLPQTSASAFAKSGFAKLADSSSSPFGALSGGTGKSLFGGKPSASASPFGALQAAKPPGAVTAPPKLSFGGTSSAASPFASANGQTSAFGSAVPRAGGLFGSGSRLGGTFAKANEPLKSDKPARPFGAPESDAEDDEEADDEENGNVSAADEVDKDDKETAEDTSAPPEDKKKTKLQKINVDDGEAGETTLLSIRAKMYHLDKTKGWLERGAGMLKVNVPTDSIEFDDDGAPRRETFDASTLGEDEGGSDEDGVKDRKVVRLVMRQDHTLRVILNTAILPGMDFQERESLKATTVLFTAFDEGEAKPVQMKMTKQNASAFTDFMKFLKRELADV